MMAQMEPQLLIQRYTEISDDRRYYPDEVLNKSVSRKLSGGYEIDMNKYRNLYYTSKFHFTSREEITILCKEYFKGLCFVIQYYTRRIPTYDWYYPYSYSPVFYDLYAYSTKYDIEANFSFRPPLTLTEALFSVIPPSKYFVLPNESLQAKMNILSRTNPMFSERVETDMSGLRRKGDDSHEAVVLLPMADYDTIKDLLKEFRLNDPEPGLFIMNRRTPYELPLSAVRVPVSPAGTFASYTIQFDVQVYPRPGEGALGAILVKGRPRYEGSKLLEYGKYVQFATDPKEVVIVGLNEILLKWIRQKDISKKRGSTLFLTSKTANELEKVSLETESPSKDIQRYKYLIHYIQTELGYRVKYEVGHSIEASEIMEDTFVSQEDRMRMYT